MRVGSDFKTFFSAKISRSNFEFTIAQKPCEQNEWNMIICFWCIIGWNYFESSTYIIYLLICKLVFFTICFEYNIFLKVITWKHWYIQNNSNAPSNLLKPIVLIRLGFAQFLLHWTYCKIPIWGQILYEIALKYVSIQALQAHT